MIRRSLNAAGLRLQEGLHLQTSDLDATRMTLRVRRGKGAQERQVPLSPRLLTELRDYWRTTRRPAATNWLFPGHGDRCYSETNVQKACHQAAPAAGLRVRVTPHTLRHSYAMQCEHCAAWWIDYNSCRDRFCPSCGGAKRAAWFAQLASALPAVPHFQLVFTLPRELSSLVLAHRRELYGLLFRAAWETLRDVALDPRHLGAEVGAVLVLHTWGQALDHHPHVHAIVPGGGLSLDGTRWIATRSPRPTRPVVLANSGFSPAPRSPRADTS